MDMNSYTLKQLKNWLKLLKKPTSGNKATLILRLNDIPADIRGECPKIADENNDECDEYSDDFFNENVDLENQSDLMQLDDVEDEGAAGVDDNAEMSDNGSAVIAKELELMRKQMELLMRENALLMREKSMQNKESSSGIETSANPKSMQLLKELVADFDGTGDVYIWAAQFDNLCTRYNLDEETQHQLFISKLKNKAFQWLHSQPNFITKNAKALLEELVGLYGVKTSILQLRKNFELRKWRISESFAQYVNEKCALATSLKLEEEELVEYLVDGIPVLSLRTQAEVSCLKTKSQLLQAFNKVDLKNFNGSSNPKGGEEGQPARCYNCYNIGHLARDCKKPKRIPGSCFQCGKTEHRFAQCPDRKKQILTVNDDDEEYVKKFRIFLTTNIYTSFTVACLIDSGSPVNFIKISILKKNKIEFSNVNKNLNYVGINKAKLKVYGKVHCFIKLRKKKINFELLVVANESMSYEAVLGRDFMNKSRIKLEFTYENDEKNYVKCDQTNLNNNNRKRIMNYYYENITNYDYENIMNYDYEHYDSENYDNENYDYKDYDHDGKIENISQSSDENFLNY